MLVFVQSWMSTSIISCLKSHQEICLRWLIKMSAKQIRTQSAKDNPARMNAMTARAINAAASTLSSAPVTGDIDVAINQFIESFIVHDRGHVIGPDYNGHTGV